MLSFLCSGASNSVVAGQPGVFLILSQTAFPQKSSTRASFLGRWPNGRTSSSSLKGLTNVGQRLLSSEFRGSEPVTTPEACAASDRGRSRDLRPEFVQVG